MTRNIVTLPGLISLFALQGACGDKVDADTACNCPDEDTGDELEAIDTTCETDEDTICVLVTATEDAITQMDAEGSSLELEVAGIIGELEVSLHNSGLDPGSQQKFDVIYVLPEALSSGSDVTEALLLTDYDTGEEVNPYRGVVFSNLEALTELPAVQDVLDADVVLILTATGFYDKSNMWDDGDRGHAIDTPEGTVTADDPVYEKLWALAQWDRPNLAMHELGHLIGADHDSTQKPACLTEAFPYNCGFTETTVDLGSMMAYSSSCAPDACTIQQMFSNPNMKDPSSNSTYMGSSTAYNACTVYFMWDYIAAVSDVMDGATHGDHALDTGTAYDGDNCPEIDPE